MTANAHVLVAARTPAYDLLHEYLEPAADLIPVDTLDKALHVLAERHDINLIVITVNFDESRMFDLLRLCTAKYPGIPVICCKAFYYDVPRISVEAMRIASGALGAAAFVNVQELEKRVGKEKLGDEFRSVVLEHIRNAK